MVAAPMVNTAPFRRLTLVWPGLPWLWLRGSRSGLVLALAFALVVDLAVLATFVWSELFDRPVVAGLWAASAAIWVAGTALGVATFPVALPDVRPEGAEDLFVAARDAYLSRDWLAAEERLRHLLTLSPIDAEAQLLLATLFRRAGRLREARGALEALQRSDCGARWRPEIDRELSLIATAETAPAEMSRLPTGQMDTPAPRLAA